MENKSFESISDTCSKTVGGMGLEPISRSSRVWADRVYQFRQPPNLADTTGLEPAMACAPSAVTVPYAKPITPRVRICPNLVWSGLAYGCLIKQPLHNDSLCCHLNNSQISPYTLLTRNQNQVEPKYEESC